MGATTSLRSARSRGGSAGAAAAGAGRVFKVAVSVLCVIVVSAAFIALAVGSPILHRRASARLSAAGTDIRVEWPQAPAAAGAAPSAWVDPSFQNEVLAAAYDAIDRSPDALAAGQLRAISESLFALGCFEARPSVTRLAGGRVTISGAWRVPAAVVEWGAGEHVISWTGHVLPTNYIAGAPRLPRVVGAALGPTVDAGGAPGVGHHWPGDDLAAAVELLLTLREQPYWRQVRGVEVQGTGRAGAPLHLIILTESDGRVTWGARVGEAAVERGEPSTDRKLWNLAQLFRLFGRIDAGRSSLAVNTELVIIDDTGTP